MHDSDREEAIAEATADARKILAESFAEVAPPHRQTISVGAVTLAAALISDLPEHAADTWLAYSAEARALAETDGPISAKWSERTGHIAISTILDLGRQIAIEAWPFLEHLPPNYFDLGGGGPYNSLQEIRREFGDLILAMPSWLEKLG